MIDALQTYVNRFDGLDLPQRDVLWINAVAKAQRELPAHVLQHYCDPDRAFFPLPDFKAKEFKRQGRFYSLISAQWDNLFSGASLVSSLSFQFGLVRGACTAAMVAECGHAVKQHMKVGI